MTPQDLSTCDREPIHIPGAIQPHGFLLAVTDAGVVEHVSENIREFFGRDAQELLGSSLEASLGSAGAALWQKARQVPAGIGAIYAGRISLPNRADPAECDLVVHPQGSRWIIEGEGRSANLTHEIGSAESAVASVLRAMEASRTARELLDVIAREMRRITGFDRVLIYAFDSQFNGTVVAESRNAALPSYLDLRFPASDIPKQARELYRLNPLRIIPNCDYDPVRIASASGRHEPLDLTYSVLRSVSPVHRAYMRNMGTPASMSVSILRDGALWGLISCHHASPRMVPFRVREICALLSQIFALQLSAREQAEQSEQRAASRAAVASLLVEVTQTADYVEGLARQGPALLELVEAAGAAIVQDGRCVLVGQCPETAVVLRIVDALSARPDAGVLATDNLAGDFPELAGIVPGLVGLLAATISHTAKSYLLWFRPEVVTTVRWGGDPTKPASQVGTELHPRHSFAQWTENVRGRSLPWRARHVTAAREMRGAIVDVALRHANKVEAMHRELSLMHRELEALSYAISHDIRGPLIRALRFGEILRDELAGRSPAELSEWAGKVVGNARNCSTLLERLLTYLQLGRARVHYEPVDLAPLIEQIRAELPLPTTSVEWTIRQLPTVQADQALLKLALRELLTNAISFSAHQDTVRVEIGAGETEHEHIVYVRDNGSGFAVADMERRLTGYARQKLTATSMGVGLAIVRRAIVRLQGRVWAESQLGAGATFFCALPRTPAVERATAVTGEAS